MYCFSLSYISLFIHPFFLSLFFFPSFVFPHSFPVILYSVFPFSIHSFTHSFFFIHPPSIHSLVQSYYSLNPLSFFLDLILLSQSIINSFFYVLSLHHSFLPPPLCSFFIIYSLIYFFNFSINPLFIASVFLSFIH